MIPPVSPETDKEMGGNSGRIGRSLRQMRNAQATWTLVRMLVLVQAVPVVWDLLDPMAGKLSLAQHHLGLTARDFLSGSFWQPISHALIHGNWPHLLANAACLILLGPKLEHIVPKRTFWLLALSSALAGAVFFMLLTPALPGADAPILVGASSICFGFLVLLTTLSPESRFLPLFLSGKSIGLGVILTNLILALLHPDLSTGPLAGWGRQLSEGHLAGLFQISHACHFGGSLAGYLCGKYLLRPRVSLASLKRAREKQEASERRRK
ncbi:rhomboid family intramembrane serine protease [Akkermansiaceae bacterium]|nr:rhomboid family intramembrane serine protease [Akkermansiaceae bacterium]